MLSKQTCYQEIPLKKLLISWKCGPQFKAKYASNVSTLKDQMISEGVATYPEDQQQETLRENYLNDSCDDDDDPVPMKRKEHQGASLSLMMTLMTGYHFLY